MPDIEKTENSRNDLISVSQEESNTFLDVFDATATTARAGKSIRLAVKANIDLAGHVTSCGTRWLLDEREAANADAECLRRARLLDVNIVGIANMNQLAFGSFGNNPDFGDVRNVLNRNLVAGGSSSGSAAAVANGWADIAFGTDTAGSIRIPAACQGVAGLKTTYGLVSVVGVEPLAPSLDTVGPIARDVAGLEAGLALLVEDFVPRPGSAGGSIGRVALEGVDPVQQLAIDRALQDAGFTSITNLPDSITESWHEAADRTSDVLKIEMYEHFGAPRTGSVRDSLDPRLVQALLSGRSLASDTRHRAATYEYLARWSGRLEALLMDRFEILALPTLPRAVPTWNEARTRAPKLSQLVNPVNAAGLPAVTLPLRSADGPASIQLIGRRHYEAQLLSTARRIEEACGRP